MGARCRSRQVRGRAFEIWADRLARIGPGSGSRRTVARARRKGPSRRPWVTRGARRRGGGARVGSRAAWCARGAATPPEIPPSRDVVAREERETLTSRPRFSRSDHAKSRRGVTFPTSTRRGAHAAVEGREKRQKLFVCFRANVGAWHVSVSDFFCFFARRTDRDRTGDLASRHEMKKKCARSRARRSRIARCDLRGCRDAPRTLAAR